MIRLEKITKTYKIREGAFKWHNLNAVDNVNMNIYDNGVTGICGVSGSGKTTLASIISGYDSYDSGTVSYTVNGMTYHKIPENTNYIRNVFQDPYISLNAGMDVMWHIERTAKLNGVTMENALKKLGMVFYDYNIYLGRKIDTLSGGERQKLAFAISLIPDPEVIVLDEPFSMLDTINLFIMLKLLKKLSDNISIVYLDNSINRILFVSDYVYIIDHGKVAESNTTDNFAIKQNSSTGRKLIECSPSIFKRIE